MYRCMAQDNEMGLVEADVIELCGCWALRVIFKKPQSPSGMTYLASLTLPFRDFSYVIKVQCQEHGMTGAREAVAALIEGDSADGFDMAEWAKDPYTGSTQGSVLANTADQRTWDADFPDHPLSRARAVLEHVERTLPIDNRARKSAPFGTTPPPRKPWWRLW